MLSQQSTRKKGIVDRELRTHRKFFHLDWKKRRLANLQRSLDESGSARSFRYMGEEERQHEIWEHRSIG